MAETSNVIIEILDNRTYMKVVSQYLFVLHSPFLSCAMGSHNDYVQNGVSESARLTALP